MTYQDISSFNQLQLQLEFEKRTSNQIHWSSDQQSPISRISSCDKVDISSKEDEGKFDEMQ